MSKPVRPKILDEELQDYQTLLDGMGVNPTPITLPYLPLLDLTPSVYGQNKRVRTSPKSTGEEDIGDTSASGSDTIPPGAAP